MHNPTLTFIPLFLNSLTPFPLTFGFGSRVDTKTFFIPESIMDFVQGPVLPVWQHGYKLTYIFILLLTLLFNFLSAKISA